MTIAKATVLICKNGQEVILPFEARLPGDIKKVEISIRGREIIIRPLENKWNKFFENGCKVSDDFMKGRSL